MDLIFILKAMAGLVVILVLLVVIFIYPARQKRKKLQEQEKKKKKSTPKKRDEVLSLVEIRDIIKDKKSSTDSLTKAIDLLIKYHAKIPAKLGMRAHPDFDIYEEIMLRLCRHPNTNKDIVLRLDRALQKENPSYARELNNALTKGLNARGI